MAAPLIDVFLRDASTGERVYDGSLVLVSETGEELVEFAQDRTLSGVADPVTGEIAPFAPGSYTIVERRAPKATGWDRTDGEQYSLAAPVAFKFDDPAARLEIVIEHTRLPGVGGTVLSDTEESGPGPEQPAKASGIGRILDALRRALAPAEALEPGSARARKALCRKGAAFAILVTAGIAWIVAPALWMTSFGLFAASNPRLGVSFAFANLVDYIVGGFLLDGWRAVAAISSVHDVPPSVQLVAVAAMAGTLFLSMRAIWRRVEAEAGRNPLLDSLPPAAGHNECGSARFIRTPDEISRALKTCDADVEELELAGPVFGYLPEPLYKTAIKTIGYDTSLLMARAARLFGKPWDDPEERAAVAAERIVYDDEDENTVITADTRAGKTRRMLLATIDFLTRATRESLLILDPKGELYALTSETVRSRSIPVNRIDFRFPRYSDRWNPMQLVIEAAAKASKAEASGNAVALREAYDEMNSAAEDLVLKILPKELDTGPNTFFNQGARSYIKSTMLFVACWKNCPDNQRSLATVSRIIDKYGAACPLDPDNPNSERLTPYIWMLDYLPRDHPAYEAFSNARSAVDKERSQFVTTALGALQDYRDSNIAALTSDTDVPLKQMGLERSVTYLIIPLEKSSYSGFATLFIQQAYQALITESTLHGGRLPYRVNLLCEEFGQIPPIDELDQKLSSSLSAGIRWILILQSVAQLQTKYGRGYDKTILAACNNKIIIKTTDVENTGKWFSELCGKYTIAIEGGSLSGKRFAIIKDNTSTSVRLGPRDLIMPDEVGKWRAQFGALMHRGASDGVFVTPLPDVSETPTQRAFGLGDKEHNRAKSERTLYGGEPPVREEIDPWSPELNKMVEKTAKGERYTDEEKRNAEAVFMARLLKRRKSAQMRGKAEATAGEANPQRFGALLDPATLKATEILPVSSDAYLASLQAHPTWLRVEQNQEHAVKNAIAQRREVIRRNRERKKSEAPAVADAKAEPRPSPRPPNQRPSAKAAEEADPPPRRRPRASIKDTATL